MPRGKKKTKDGDVVFAALGLVVFAGVVGLPLGTVLAIAVVMAASGVVIALLVTAWQRQERLVARIRRLWPPVDRPARRPAWTVELIERLEWKRFEELCAAYFQAKGRRAVQTQLGADGGIDIHLYRRDDPNRLLGVVQCKAWRKPVGVREIRELFGVMTHCGCPLGVYMTVTGFTAEARAFAQDKHIQLLAAPQLLKLIQALPPVAQEALFVRTTAGDYTTPTCPSCGIKLVLRSGRRGGGQQRFWGCSNFPRCRTTLTHRAGNGSVRQGVDRRGGAAGSARTPLPD